ncbi:Dps family protein [Actinomadura nitritigenes]|jgi:starvation-inducible DNA-binding protein|uniref:DNA starvation/stationary phase protection protein n=1 Tax=Actinomadura nitritigenes TaxID=134602 RepID=A0ABS3QS79_9ACTN|nr:MULTISPECIES: DNA starvation/stationary phase protection protein [Actinomadura]MBD2893743.1 DNA protection during starvation protein 2 [Actinomadura sp. RB99]MBO2436825.1 DNA starvation/stationary phase protection protein [Actinomadura nitritigenes]HEU5027109.1 DNA starvation/stationary phase protection protein [Spirillospora sp.]
MAAVKSPLSDEALKVTGQALQGALVDLIDLSLVAKQAHWNLTGRNFKVVHEHLDEVVDLARAGQDDVAERAVAIGVNPDGRARTVADRTEIPQLEAGYLADDKVVAAVTDVLAQIIARFRERIAATDEPDPVTQDLLIGIAAQLEKQHWMFQAQT